MGVKGGGVSKNSILSLLATHTTFLLTLFFGQEYSKEDVENILVCKVILWNGH